MKGRLVDLTWAQRLAKGLAGIEMLLPDPYIGSAGSRATLREVVALLGDGDSSTAFELAAQALERLQDDKEHGPETFLLAGVISILAHAQPVKQGARR